MRIRKLVLFAIWKVSSAILGPTGRKTPAWLRQSSAGAQPWLLTGCYVPSQTFSKFFGCGIGIELARSKHLSMQRAFPSPWQTPKHVLITIRIWKIPGHDGQRDRAWGTGSCRDGDGAAAPAACGGSTQACRGRWPHVTELQPPYAPFCSAWLFFLIRHQPHCVQPAQKVPAPHTSRLWGLPKEQTPSAPLSPLYLPCFSISPLLREKN